MPAPLMDPSRHIREITISVVVFIGAVFVACGSGPSGKELSKMPEVGLRYPGSYPISDVGVCKPNPDSPRSCARFSFVSVDDRTDVAAWYSSELASRGWPPKPLASGTPPQLFTWTNSSRNIDIVLEVHADGGVIPTTPLGPNVHLFTFILWEGASK